MRVDDESLTTVAVTLSRTIDRDGKMHFTVSTPDIFNAVEVLGLLEAGKFYIFNEMSKGRGYGDE